MPLGVPTFAMRGAAQQCVLLRVSVILDELALAAGRDPIEFRLQLLKNERVMNTKPSPVANGFDFDAARMANVLEIIRDASGWGKQKAQKGRGMGTAFQFSHRGYFAHVIDLSVDDKKQGESSQSLRRRATSGRIS